MGGPFEGYFESMCSSAGTLVTWILLANSTILLAMDPNILVSERLIETVKLPTQRWYRSEEEKKKFFMETSNEFLYGFSKEMDNCVSIHPQVSGFCMEFQIIEDSKSGNLCSTGRLLVVVKAFSDNRTLSYVFRSLSTHSVSRKTLRKQY